MSVDGTLVSDKMRRFKGECAHLRFNQCLIYNHYGANAKFNTNSHETDYSAWMSVVPWTADADTLGTPAGGPVH